MIETIQLYSFICILKDIIMYKYHGAYLALHRKSVRLYVLVYVISLLIALNNPTIRTL